MDSQLWTAIRGSGAVELREAVKADLQRLREVLRIMLRAKKHSKYAFAYSPSGVKSQLTESRRPDQLAPSTWPGLLRSPESRAVRDGFCLFAQFFNGAGSSEQHRGNSVPYFLG